MLKKLLCAAVVAASIQAVASAQDVFIAFSDTPIGIADTAFGVTTDLFLADSLGGAVDVLGRTNVEANVGDTLTGFVLVDSDQAINFVGLEIQQPTNANVTNLDILQFQIPTFLGTSTRFTSPLVELVDADAATLVAANFGFGGLVPGTLASSGINPILSGFDEGFATFTDQSDGCLLYTSPSPRDATLSRMPSSA